MRAARTLGFTAAALAYLTFLVIAGAEAGSVAGEAAEHPPGVEVVAQLP